MSLQSHLRELQRKHQALEAKIALEQNRPSSEDLLIKNMKKQKLRIKDRIRRSRSSAA
ncbi:MAG: DUF465 domain-containing protein [Neomegalonema sp.]|nr:DUF465 domain-containing protein [Neomegalonema sp.]